MRSHLSAVLLATAALAVTAPAVAQSNGDDGEYGSAVYFTKRNCPADATVACDGRGTGQQVVQGLRAGGAFNEVNAGFAATGTGVGSTATASVKFGAFGLPTIKASANAVGSVRIGAFIASYQVYTYTGEQDLEDLRLSAAFHVVNSSTDGGDGTLPGGAFASAGFTIWDEDDFFTYADAYFTGTGNFSSPASLTNQSYLFGTISCQAFQDSYDPQDLPVGQRASNTFAIPALQGGEASFTGAQENCHEQTLTLHQGDEFVIASYVQLIANRNGFVDATGTFTLGLDPSMSEADQQAFRENVTYNAGGAVPEPATWAMLIAGFGGIGGAMRRRRAGVAFAA